MGFFSRFNRNQPNQEQPNRTRQEEPDPRSFVKPLADRDPVVRRNTLKAVSDLGLLGDVLTAAHSQKAWRACNLLIEELAVLPYAAVIKPLITVLADPSAEISSRAAESAVRALDYLRWTPPQQIVAPPLYVKTKQSMNLKALILEHIRQKKWDECVKIGEPAVPLLFERLVQLKAFLEDPKTLWHDLWPAKDEVRDIFKSLGKIGEPAIAPLLQWLKQYGTDKRGDELTSEISDALSKIGKPALEPLIAAFGSGPPGDVFDGIVLTILGRIGGARAVAFLMELADKSTSDSIRWYCLQALSFIDKEAAPAADLWLRILNTPVPSPFRGVQDNSNPDYLGMTTLNSWAAAQIYGDVRILAAKALGRIRDPRAVQPLIALKNDWNFELRSTAEKALKDIAEIRNGE